MRRCVQNHPHNQQVLSNTLCHLIQRQNAPPPGGLTYLHSLSGFTRRLVLQILLETECVLLHVTTTSGVLSTPPSAMVPHQLHHPKFGIGPKSRLLYLPTSTKVDDVVRMVTDSWPSCNVYDAEKEFGAAPSEGGRLGDLENHRLDILDKLAVAAKGPQGAKAPQGAPNGKKASAEERGSRVRKSGVTATGAGPPFVPAAPYGLVHEDLLQGVTCLPSELSLAQVMAAVEARAITILSLALVQRRGLYKDNPEGTPEVVSLLKTKPLPSALRVFTSQGGLSVLAQHMALLYPDTSHQIITSVSSRNLNEEYKVDMNLEDDFVGFQVNDILVELNQSGFGSSPGRVRGSPMNLLSISPIPPHALGAFTLFLRLPGFAETLLVDMNKACCLLKLALGVNSPTEDPGDACGLSSNAGSLATLPFQVLEILLKSTPLTTDDGRLLRRTCLTAGALHLILACLTALSHQDTAPPEVISTLTHPNVPIGLVVATARSSGSVPTHEANPCNHTDNDRFHYWAKGTGFGTGSTTQSWNVEQALNRQKMEEEHVVWLIRLLAQYINPGDTVPPDVYRSVAASWELNSAAAPDVVGCSSEASTPTTPSTPKPPMSLCSAPSVSAPDALPAEVFDLFLNSGLISKVASYLSNDSVLDMSRHVPLYRALLSLVRGIAVTPTLTPLLTKLRASPNIDKAGESTTRDLPSLLHKMMSTVNTYMNKLRWRGRKKTKMAAAHPPPPPLSPHIKDVGGDDGGGSTDGDDEGENDEGLSLLVPDILLSSNIVKVSMEKFIEAPGGQDGGDGVDGASGGQEEESFIDIYLNAMKPLQFDSYEMIVEDPEGGGVGGTGGSIRFVVPYNYERFMKGDLGGGGGAAPKRVMKRLAQEAVTLSTSLPLSYSSTVFVRTDVDRLDVMKVLITGPEDTPYANGCFEFDVYFPMDYPNSPLNINLQTTGEKKVRFNPNLYMDGKVCLSILNTWHGRPEEKWNPQTSSLLQVLVSIQSLILVSEPYFNEPGYERSRGKPSALHISQEYDANIRTATVRWAILNQLRNPSPCFKDAIERHFWLKQKDILSQVESWIAEIDELSENRRFRRAVSHQVLALRNLHQLLKTEFSKMTPPKGLEHIKLPDMSGKTGTPPTEPDNSAEVPVVPVVQDPVKRSRKKEAKAVEPNSDESDLGTHFKNKLSEEFSFDLWE